MRGPAVGRSEQTARGRTRRMPEARDPGKREGCPMRGPAEGWPEQTAGGLRGATPPGLGVRGLSPDDTVFREVKRGMAGAIAAASSWTRPLMTRDDRQPPAHRERGPQ